MTEGKLALGAHSPYRTSIMEQQIQKELQTQETRAPNGDETRNPQVQNPQVQNPQVQNPQVQNPQVQGPEAQGPEAQNQQPQNPQVRNPAAEHQVQNPEPQNPQVGNPAAEHQVQNPEPQSPHAELSEAQKAQTQSLHNPQPQTQMGQRAESNPQDFSRVVISMKRRNGFHVAYVEQSFVRQVCFEVFGQEIRLFGHQPDFKLFPGTNFHVYVQASRELLLHSQRFYLYQGSNGHYLKSDLHPAPYKDNCEDIPDNTLLVIFQKRHSH